MVGKPSGPRYPGRSAMQTLLQQIIAAYRATIFSAGKSRETGAE
jgi:hypothetical protein